jgi:hypothetical protein
LAVACDEFETCVQIPQFWVIDKHDLGIYNPHIIPISTPSRKGTMAPRRKQQATELRQQGKEVKLRVPERTMEFIQKRAKAEQRSINATIVKMLEQVPDLELFLKLDDLSARYEEMFNRAELSFARYSQEIAWQNLSRTLIETVDIILQGNFEAEADPPLRAALNELRAVRAQMRIQQKNEERTDFVDRSPKR